MLSKITHASNWPWADREVVLHSVADSEKRKEKTCGRRTEVKGGIIMSESSSSSRKRPPRITPWVNINHFSGAVWGILACCLPNPSIVQTVGWALFDVKTGSRLILTQLQAGLSILKCTWRGEGKRSGSVSAELCGTNVEWFNVFLTETPWSALQSFVLEVANEILSLKIIFLRQMPER